MTGRLPADAAVAFLDDLVASGEVGSLELPKLWAKCWGCT